MSIGVSQQSHRAMQIVLSISGSNVFQILHRRGTIRISSPRLMMSVVELIRDAIALS
jgi:hypothetical protein